jgi:hypothetical protein
VANRDAGIPSSIEEAEANRPAAGNTNDSAGNRTAVQFNQLTRQPASRSDSDLLTEDSTHGDLKSVPPARSAKARPECDQSGERRVCREMLIDGLNVGSKVEQAAYPGNNRW